MGSAAKPLLMYGTLEDISEQKQRQLALQLKQKLTSFQAKILSSKVIFAAEQDSWGYFCQQIAQALNVERVSIWLDKNHSQQLTCQHLHLDKDQHKSASQPSQLKLSITQYPQYFKALEQEAIIATTDVSQCLAMAELTDCYLKPEKIVSKLDGIIMSDSGPAGIIWVETTESTKQQRQWHSEELRFMLTMSSIASTILSLMELKRLNNAYQHTNNLLTRTSELATIGLWELALPDLTIHWNKVTRQIHEVTKDYIPDATVAINFYRQGDNRTRIEHCLEQAMTKNMPFDDNFEIITAKGNKKWVRVVAHPEFVAGECRRVFGLFQDITAITQSYHALQQSNEELELTQQRLDVASQNARIGFWQAWPETGELWWSSVVFQVFGFDEATTIPSIDLFKQCLHPDDATLVAISEKNAKTSGIHDVIHRIITPDGSVRWVHELAKLLPNSDKGHATFVGSVQDITEKVIAEQAHYRLTSLLQTVLDAASEVSIIAIDTEGIIQLVNKGAEAMLGYQADELIHQQSLAILHDQNEVAARATELSEKYAESIIGVDVFTVEAQRYGFERRRWIYQCKDGSELLVQVIVTPMRDEQNTITGYLCLAHDITMQEHISFELNQFFNLSQSLLCISSPAGYFIRVNKAFHQVLGHSEAELLKQPILNFVHPDDMAKTQVELVKILEGSVSASFSNRLRHKEGHYISLEWFTAVDPDTGKLYSAAQDITERLKLEQLKSEFVSTVSHELRTPITSITGALGLVLSGMVGELQPESKKLLNIASSNCDRLANLINDLLDIEKLNAGKMQVELATYAVASLLQRAIEENQTYSSKQDIQLNWQLPLAAQQWQIRIDEFRFLQIMANLISNAIKFSPANSQVTVTAEVKQAAEQSMLVIAVTDQGSGIAEYYKPRIFEKFSQADASDAREKGGTGLGLALSKELAEAMGGTISFDSSVGKGSTFYVHFPLISA
ncbi:PAS domain S-box protein [Rheinheimera salexigens]|uniref:PAS domain S-box protein n=1 Tax=Rheinheimera salexigens TaxID=1628148 RepID=UPI00114C99A5|nr:PAS domain S-box protein [Rheinheimera salexigens]